MQTTGWHALKEKGLDLSADESPSRENMHFYVACTVNGLWMLFWLFLTLYAYSFGTSHSQWAEDDEDLSAISIHVWMHMKKRQIEATFFREYLSTNWCPFMWENSPFVPRALCEMETVKRWCLSCFFFCELEKKEKNFMKIIFSG